MNPTRLLCLALPMLAMGAEFTVAPNGSDTASGTHDQPLASLATALAKARPFIGRESVVINLAPGVHRLMKPVVIGASESGTAAAPVVIVGAPDTVISGSGALTGLRWTPGNGGILSAEVPADLETDQVFVNGEALVMARYPNWQTYAPGVYFNGSAPDALAPERVARWSNPTGGIIHAMHQYMWGDMKWSITGKDAAGGLTMVGGWQNNRPTPMHEKIRMVENIREELDTPGEWYHDRVAHRLLVIPPRGVDLASATIEVVKLRHLLEFRGTKQNPIHHVTLRNISFRHTARTFMENKEPLMRSDWTIYRGGALLFDGAEDCTIEECTLDQLGGNAVFVNGYNRRIAIKRTSIERCGTNAIAFIGLPTAVRNPLFRYEQTLPLDQLDLTPGPKTDDYPADCLVEDCLINRFAQVEKQSTGVQIQMAARITIRQCSIYDCPRAAINIGDGCWGGHLIEDNDVFDTVKETGDHGSFNSWGRDRFWVPDINVINQRVAAKPELPLLDAVETTVLRHNRWRYDHAHGWDVDLDDGSTNYLIENNLCLGKGIKLREGFKRTVRNNICVENGLHPHVWPANSGDIVESNIFPKGYDPALMPPNNWGERVDRNLLGSKSLLKRSRKNGCDTNSAVGDPQFRDPATGDYRVADGSPAIALGFVNFPMDSFGVKTPRLKAKARTAIDAPSAAHAATTETVTTAWLGATITSVTTIGQVSATGLPDAAGVLLVKVPAGSRAAALGFAARDVIRKVDGIAVKTVGDFLENIPKKPRVRIAFYRNQVVSERVVDQIMVE